MNTGILCVTAASEEQITCGLYILPAEMLQDPAPDSIYTQEQLDALAMGRAFVPTLTSVSGSPSLLQMAGAIPDALPTGATLPLVSVLTRQTSDTWSADVSYRLSVADITPYCNPEETLPTIGSAWAMLATITYESASSRELFDPSEYDPPITVGSKQLYFPKFANFARSYLEIMRDNASPRGAYWYRSFALLRPAYIFLYATSGSPFIDHPISPNHPFYSITVDAFGILMSDQAYYYYDAYTSKWYNTLVSGSGYQQEPMGPSSIGGRVYSNAPGHWSPPNTPAKVVPGQRRKAAGIIAPVTALLLLGSLLMVGASSQILPGRRRRKKSN